MRLIAAGLAAFALAACGEEAGPYIAAGPDRDSAQADEAQDATAPQGSADRVAARCSGRHRQPIAFTGEAAEDRITIVVDRETCAEAAALVTVRASDDTLLIAEAFALKALALTEPPNREDLHSLLSSFTENIRRRPAGELPPFDDATREGQGNPSPIRPVASREIYERARSEGGNVICFPIHYESFECVWFDRERGHAVELYRSGP